MTARRPLVAGNWKMNGHAAALRELASLAAKLEGASPPVAVDVLIAPPATLVAQMVWAARGTRIAVGGQDCHARASGAHTGDVAAEMLRDAGATAVIVGHSERRADHGERDQDVLAKAAAAHRAGLAAIVCIGETLGQRQAGMALDVARRQLVASVPTAASAADTVIAYEPVWAIGTGLTPSAADIAEMHAALRQGLADHVGAAGRDIRVLYGGSVNPRNAKEILSIADVDGALVGGASLKADDFWGIISAYA